MQYDLTKPRPEDLRFSQFLNMCVDDLEKIESNDRFYVDMDVWVDDGDDDEDGNACGVCLGGSFLIHSALDPEVLPQDGQMSRGWKTYFHAIDQLARAKSRGYLDLFGLPWEQTQSHQEYIMLHAVSYESDPKAFKDYVRDVANFFEKEGM